MITIAKKKKISFIDLTPRREVPRSNGTPLSDGMKGG
jgi:hypothetical protein